MQLGDRLAGPQQDPVANRVLALPITIHRRGDSVAIDHRDLVDPDFVHRLEEVDGQGDPRSIGGDRQVGGGADRIDVKRGAVRRDLVGNPALDWVGAIVRPSADQVEERESVGRLVGARRRCADEYSDEGDCRDVAMEDVALCRARLSHRWHRRNDEAGQPARGLARRHQVRAKASKLEHSSTRLAVVSAKNPPETASWFCMVHLPLSMLVRID